MAKQLFILTFEFEFKIPLYGQKVTEIRLETGFNFFTVLV